MSRRIPQLAASALIALSACSPPVPDENTAQGNPLESGVMRIFGSTGDGRRGLPVAGGIDCDADGVADTAFGAMQANPDGRTAAGEVVVVFGNGTIDGELDTAGFGDTFLKIAGSQPHENIGSELWMDDVTGDGVAEILVCRQNHTPVSGRAGAGALTIIFGGSALRQAAANGRALDIDDLPSDVQAVTVFGPASYDRLGIWVRSGDVTGDGVADIVLGADEIDTTDEPNRGAVFVIRGGAHLFRDASIDLAEFGRTPWVGHLARIDPPSGSPFFHFGATCQIADLDGNGRGEVLAAAALERGGAGLRLPGAPFGTGQQSGGSPRGTVYIVWDSSFPDSDWPAGYRFVVDDPPDNGASTVITGPANGRTFGEELLGGLDYDGDGRAELFIGDLLADAGNGLLSGVGYVIYDAANLRDRIIDFAAPPMDIVFTTILGPIDGALGGDTATHGDYDGDGLGDVVFGSPHDSPGGRINAGSIHVIYGTRGGWPATLDLFPTEWPPDDVVRIVRINGGHGRSEADEGDTLGYSAASGDLNGDGLMDIVVNEMAGNGLGDGTTDVGNLVIISGAALAPPAP
jgi:hypothetical protein